MKAWYKDTRIMTEARRALEEVGLIKNYDWEMAEKFWSAFERRMVWIHMKDIKESRRALMSGFVTGVIVTVLALVIRWLMLSN